jgi:tetratricopeptide (TPR) repeat protein
VGFYTRSLGPAHAHTLSAKLTLAGLLKTMGQAERARPLYEEAVKGAGQEDKLRAMVGLALLLKETAEVPSEEECRACGGVDCVVSGCPQCARTEQMDEAATLLTSVVEARVAELGPEHADSARAKMQLAVLRQQMGSADEEAMALYREVIDARTAELDEARAAPAKGLDRAGEQRLTLGVLRAQMNLAILLDEAVRTDEARALYEEVVAGYRRVRGAGHADTLGAQLNLAVLVDEVGEEAPLAKQLYHLRVIIITVGTVD